MVQPTAGGNVNAANLNLNGLNALAAVLGTDTLLVAPTAGGPNRRVSVAAINAQGVPDPLLLGDGTEADPTYSYASESDAGAFLSSVGVLGWTVGGSEVFNMSATRFAAANLIGCNNCEIRSATGCECGGGALGGMRPTYCRHISQLSIASLFEGPMSSSGEERKRPDSAASARTPSDLVADCVAFPAERVGMQFKETR